MTILRCKKSCQSDNLGCWIRLPFLITYILQAWVYHPSLQVLVLGKIFPSMYKYPIHFMLYCYQICPISHKYLLITRKIISCKKRAFSKRYPCFTPLRISASVAIFIKQHMTEKPCLKYRKVESGTQIF